MSASDDWGPIGVALVIVLLVAIAMGLADRYAPDPPAAPPPFCASTTAPAAERCRGGTP